MAERKPTVIYNVWRRQRTEYQTHFGAIDFCGFIDWFIVSSVDWLTDWLTKGMQNTHVLQSDVVWRHQRREYQTHVATSDAFRIDLLTGWLIDWSIDRLTRGLQNTDVLQCDVTNEENIKHISEQVKQQFNKLGRYFDICEKDFFEI